MHKQKMITQQSLANMEEQLAPHWGKPHKSYIMILSLFTLILLPEQQGVI